MLVSGIYHFFVVFRIVAHTTGFVLLLQTSEPVLEAWRTGHGPGTGERRFIPSIRQKTLRFDRMLDANRIWHPSGPRRASPMVSRMTVQRRSRSSWFGSVPKGLSTTVAVLSATIKKNEIPRFTRLHEIPFDNRVQIS